MRKIALVLASLVLFSFTVTTAYAEPPAELIVLELRLDGTLAVSAVATDNSMTNPDYKLLRWRWFKTAQYWINTANSYGFKVADVTNSITASAETWDVETGYTVFAYMGSVTLSAGTRDGYNMVAWGAYSQSNTIAVTFIWAVGRRMIETDTRMNTYYSWSLNGEADKMDVQNIMTHEFGHWAGLADLYASKDYWLTMYGYASYGETYKRTLGLGDILGLRAVYGS